MHAIHGAASYIARTGGCDKSVEGSKSLHLGSSGIQEGGGQDVHALDVSYAWSIASTLLQSGRDTGVGLGVDLTGMTKGSGTVTPGFGAAAEAGRGFGANGGRGLPAVDTGLVGVVKGPGGGVEQSGERVFGDAAAEEGIGSEGTEGVVANFGVRRGRALADEIEVARGWEGRSTQKDQPDIDAEFSLELRVVSESEGEGLAF